MNETPGAYQEASTMIAGNQGPATPTLGPGLKSAPIAPQRSKTQPSLRRLEAGQEGHHKLLGKAGVSEDFNVDLLQNPLSVPTGILPLAGLT